MILGIFLGNWTNGTSIQGIHIDIHVLTLGTYLTDTRYIDKQDLSVYDELRPNYCILWY
jgi:hypothetical protein